jgi:alanine racemase
LVKPSVRLLAVLKADGYGHGAASLARAASAPGANGAGRKPKSSLWGFGVSSVEEGMALREKGLSQRILILGSLFPFESFEAALEHDLTPTVASRAAAQSLAKAAARRRRPVPVHVKVDTGMGRIGMSPERVSEALSVIQQSPGLRLEGLYTHLAQAESAEVTRQQLTLFKTAAQAARRVAPGVLIHAANSAALFHFPESHFDMVRPGLALYGIVPPEDRRSAAFRRVMSWRTRAVFLKTVPPRTPVSYGGTFRTRRRSRLATLPVGYADGYRRALSNRGQVLVKGRRCPVVGRVTMDQIIVDVTDVPPVDVGEEVVLLGSQGRETISAEEMAAWADTIPYEILCGITSRVPRVVK